jgi:hypothetical protein
MTTLTNLPSPGASGATSAMCRAFGSGDPARWDCSLVTRKRALESPAARAGTPMARAARATAHGRTSRRRGKEPGLEPLVKTLDGPSRFVGSERSREAVFPKSFRNCFWSLTRSGWRTTLARRRSVRA